MDKKYTWDLTKFFKDRSEFDKAVELLREKSKSLISYKGRILENDKTLLEFLRLEDELIDLKNRIYVYAFLSYYGNMEDKNAQDLKEQAIKIDNEYDELTSFVEPEIMDSTKEYVMSLIDRNKDLEIYRFYFEKEFRYKEHTLSDVEEELLSKISPALGNNKSAFGALDDADVYFGEVKNDNGELELLTHGNRGKFLRSKNRALRKEVSELTRKYYQNHINTLSVLYSGKVKENFVLSNVRKYNSPLECSMYYDALDVSLYENLIKVTNNNLDKFQEYFHIIKKILNLDKFYSYDTLVPIVEMDNREVEYDEAVKTVLEALKPLGEEYISDLEKYINSRSIDVYPRKGKRSGGFSWNAYKISPYICLNYNNQFREVSTLAHECGHSLHSYYTDLRQPFIYSDQPIFIAEIASTVNEILLSNYQISNASSDSEKLFYLNEHIRNFLNTTYSQVMFAEFEKIVHDKYQNGISLTRDELCRTYKEIYERYYKGVFDNDDMTYTGWSCVPHFYNSFYVYKYATGYICALTIANKLINNEEGFKDKYLEFLSSGDSDYSLNLIKKLGIDITDEIVMQEAYDIFGQSLKDLAEVYMRMNNNIKLSKKKE